MLSNKSMIIALPFFIASIIIVILHILFHPIRVLGMDTSIFYMDEKYTLASFMTTVTAFLTGFIFLVVAGKEKGKLQKVTSVGTGIFFIALSFDEFFEIHEYANTIIKHELGTSTYFGLLSNLSWIFPLSIFIAFVFMLLFLKIFTEKAPFTKRLLILGATSFFVVLVFEMIGSLTYGQDIYVYSVALEEGLEMIGVSFFLTASLTKLVS